MNKESIKVACSNCNLRELCMPLGLSEQELLRVDELVAVRRTVKRGASLFHNGEKFTSLYAIRTGFFKTTVNTEDGRDQVTGFQMAGEIIGLNTRVITAASVDAGSITQGSALIVPVNLAADVLEIARDGGDPDYVSPYLDELPTDPGLPVGATAVANGWTREGEGGDCTGSSTPDDPQQLTDVAVGDTLQAEFTLEGVPTGLPLSIDFYLADGTRVDTLSGSWDGDESSSCIAAPLTIQGDVPGVTAELSLGQDGEVAAENPVVFPDNS